MATINRRKSIPRMETPSPGLRRRVGRPLRDSITQTLRSCCRGSGQKHIWTVHRPRSPTHGRIRDRHSWPDFAPWNRRPDLRGTVGSRAKLGCLYLVIRRAWSPSCRQWQGVSKYLFCTALHCRVGPRQFLDCSSQSSLSRATKCRTRHVPRLSPRPACTYIGSHSCSQMRSINSVFDDARQALNCTEAL